MKKLSIIASLLVFAMLVSCSSDDDGGTMNPPMNDVTYTADVKAIIDGNCLNCHQDPPINGAPMSLVTAAQVQEAVQNRNLIGRVENGSMPPGAAPDLTAAQIQTLKDWETGGFK